MKAVILSGSSRANNNTLRVCKAIKLAFEDQQIDTKLIDFQSYDLPFFNGEDVDRKDFEGFRKELVDSWGEAKIVVMVSPEYNWFPSAELVNMMHHFGSRAFQDLFDEKVFAFGGVSTGRGGRLPSMQLSSIVDKLVSHLGLYSVCSPLKFESHYSSDELDEDGRYTQSSPYQHHLTRFVNYTLKLSAKFQ